MYGDTLVSEWFTSHISISLQMLWVYLNGHLLYFFGIKWQSNIKNNTIIQGHQITFSVLFFTYLKSMESSKHMDNI